MKNEAHFPPGHFKVNVAFNPNNKIGQYHEFIGVYDNAVSTDICNKVIQEFNKKKFHWHEDEQFDERSLGRYDKACDLQELVNCDGEVNIIRDSLFSCLSEYKSVFTAVDIPLYFTTMKLQSTPPGGGYHVWHSESTSLELSCRSITWMIYLNNINHGGETEFLYQGQRISPRAGTILLWPAGYTHPHRGNPPLKENKYILTGWFLYTP